MMQITQEIQQALQNNARGIATIDVGANRRRSWQEFYTRITKLAGGLKELGFKKGERLAVLLPNCDVHLEYYFATIWAGGIFVPLNTRLTSTELDRILKNCGPKFLVMDSNSVSISDDILKSTPVEKRIFTGEAADKIDFIDHESIIQGAEPIPDQSSGGDDVAMIIYTGGTTGSPKGAMLTHNNIISNAHSALSVLDDEKPWRYLHAAPMYHIADCQWNTGVTMVAGTHVFIDKFDPKEVLSVVDRYKITHTALVPTMIRMLCNDQGFESYNLSSLRKINFGGSPGTPELIQKARQIFPDCKFIQGYGLTETSPNISMLPDMDNAKDSSKIESAGQPVPGMRVKIVDEDGHEVPNGTVGEIITKGPHVMAGYWNNPKETDQTLRNGWLHTGDLGYLDEDGFIFIVDRLKDMIITGGENVYSTEVESVIEKLDVVDSCAVIGIPDETWGEAVYAIINPKDGLTLSIDEIKSHCRKFLADYKCPKHVEFRTRPMPMSGPGKILKRKLRKPFWD